MTNLALNKISRSYVGKTYRMLEKPIVYIVDKNINFLMELLITLIQIYTSDMQHLSS